MQTPSIQSAPVQPGIKSIKSNCQVFPFSRLSSPEHLHANFEVVICGGGTVHATVDGREIALSAGEMLVIFPGTLHSYDRSEGCRGVALSFSRELLVLQEYDFSALRPTVPALRIASLDRDVAHCLERLREMAAPGKMDETLAGAYLSLLFIRILPHLQLSETGSAVPGDLLYQAMQYISQNVSRPLSLRNTARALGVNEYYLSHVLNERLRMGFRTYLNTLRVERSRRLLRATSRPIEDIAAACGFANLRTFDRVFAERCGCSPREFRRAAMESDG